MIVNSVSHKSEAPRNHSTLILSMLAIVLFVSPILSHLNLLDGNRTSYVLCENADESEENEKQEDKEIEKLFTLVNFNIKLNAQQKKVLLKKDVLVLVAHFMDVLTEPPEINGIA